MRELLIATALSILIVGGVFFVSSTMPPKALSRVETPTPTNRQTPTLPANSQAVPSTVISSPSVPPSPPSVAAPSDPPPNRSPSDSKTMAQVPAAQEQPRTA